jgi:hypothetical protein
VVLAYFGEVPEIVLQGLRKPRETSASIADLKAEILTQELQSMKQEY